jgi:hypothetical protein
MNAVSNSPDLFINWLQQQNITQKVSKTPVLKEEEEKPVKQQVEEKEVSEEVNV